MPASEGEEPTPDVCEAPRSGAPNPGGSRVLTLPVHVPACSYQHTSTGHETRDMSKNPMRVRARAVVYLTPRERELLERLMNETGLSRTEIFRRGLRRIADEMLSTRRPGASIDYLVSMAEDGDAPNDLAKWADHYLYGGGHAERRKARGAGSR